VHELSIAERLLPPVLEVAEAHRARVTQVVVQAGALQQIVPESLALCFTAVAEGTPAEGAELRVETLPVTARCRRCDLAFEVDDYVFLCPTCGVADVETTGGTELVLARLELEPCESTSSTTS
jgi:hydrogenase nickel incorporation protein HypA/HybF